MNRSRVGVAQGYMVKRAPIIGDVVGLILMSQQLVKEMFRVIGLRNAVSSCFLNEQFPRCSDVGVPKLECDRVDGASIPILIEHSCRLEKEVHLQVVLQSEMEGHRVVSW